MNRSAETTRGSGIFGDIEPDSFKKTLPFRTKIGILKIPVTLETLFLSEFLFVTILGTLVCQEFLNVCLAT